MISFFPELLWCVARYLKRMPLKCLRIVRLTYRSAPFWGGGGGTLKTPGIGVVGTWPTSILSNSKSLQLWKLELRKCWGAYGPKSVISQTDMRDKSGIRGNVFCIILQPTLRSTKWSLPFRFSDRKLECTSHFSQACLCSSPQALTKCSQTESCIL
jgi:hypothetical protein